MFVPVGEPDEQLQNENSKNATNPLVDIFQGDVGVALLPPWLFEFVPLPLSQDGKKNSLIELEFGVEHGLRSEAEQSHSGLLNFCLREMRDVSLFSDVEALHDFRNAIISCLKAMKGKQVVVGIRDTGRFVENEDDIGGSNVGAS